MHALFSLFLLSFDVQVPGVEDDDVDVAARLWRSFFYLWISMLEDGCNL